MRQVIPFKRSAKLQDVDLTGSKDIRLFGKWQMQVKPEAASKRPEIITLSYLACDQNVVYDPKIPFLSGHFGKA